jgi:2-dehydro-3-deoxyphosphogluconate aldolase/(4S)-4-hydroxy-2-oxoglutarate aldolase
MINQNARPEPSLALQKNPIVAVLRARHARDYARVIDALLNGGIRSIEVTLSTEGVFNALPHLRKKFGHDADIGIGTVTPTEETARPSTGDFFRRHPGYGRDYRHRLRSPQCAVYPGA